MIVSLLRSPEAGLDSQIVLIQGVTWIPTQQIQQKEPCSVYRAIDEHQLVVNHQESKVIDVCAGFIVLCPYQDAANEVKSSVSPTPK